MKKLMLIIALFSCLGFFGCTENSRARRWGGTTEIRLPANTKLVIATWKESDLWYLLRVMKPDEKPEIFVMHESSSWGLLEGKIIFHESKQ